jgi:uncharacterized protein
VSGLSSQIVVLDTGPLVALLNARETHHAWVKSQFATLRPPLFTCEPVLTEACHLLRQIPTGREAVLSLLLRGVIAVDLALEAEAEAVEALLRRYRDLPMSLADACLVRMAELNGRCRVLTFDSDFEVYRRNVRQPIEVLRPPPA